MRSASLLRHIFRCMMQTEKCERTDQDLAGQHAPEVSTQSNAGDSCENKYNADGGTSQVDQHGDGSLAKPVQNAAQCACEK